MVHNRLSIDVTEQGSIENLIYGEWEKSVLILYMNS